MSPQLETWGPTAAVNSPAPPPPRLLQDWGFSAVRAPVPHCFGKASGSRLTKWGMRPHRPHGHCPAGPSTSAPSSPPLLQQDCLPALEGTQCTGTTALHTGTPVQFGCLKLIANRAARCCLPNAQNSYKMLSISSSTKQTKASRKQANFNYAPAVKLSLFWFAC